MALSSVSDVSQDSEPRFWFRKKQIQRIIISISVIGFMVQFLQVSLLYFEYKTRTLVELTSPVIIKPHHLAVCVRFYEILDQERLQKETGIDMKRTQTRDDALRKEDRLTVAQIFEYTPQAEEFISECFIRPDNWQIRESSGKDCYNFFMVRRFFYLNYMCYSVKETLNRSLTLQAVTQTPLMQQRILGVTLGPKFRAANVVMPMAFRKDTPYDSRDYSPLLPDLKLRNSSEFKHNVIDVFASDTTFHGLEPPYDTACVDNINPPVCMKACMIHNFAAFDRLPHIEMLYKRWDKRALSIRDINNVTMLSMATVAFNECKPKCMLTECESSHSRTAARLELDEGPDVKVLLLTSTDSDITITAQPTMTFIEYFSFVAGCFGTWFGLSFLSLNPLNFLLKRMKKKHEERNRRRSRVPDSGQAGVRESRYPRQAFSSNRLRRIMSSRR